MKAVAAFAALPALLLAAAPLSAQAGEPYASYGQSYGQSSYGQSYSYGSQPYYHGTTDYGRYGQGGYYGGNHGYGYGYDYSYGGQRDVPGDYRCDAYWDRGRSDCSAGWRDQRAYGYGSSRPGHSYGHGGHNYYSSQSGRGYGGGTTYYGAYGQPDVVYSVPTGGYGGHYGQDGHYGQGQHGQGGRNPGRIEWCRATYRSYDPHSGYYRAYSGRLVYCG